jgi:UDP-GlcNAc:undecaprenyl-phosphate/decaprenyl-phosphate GlcNAc-1-phosphate transferase
MVFRPLTKIYAFGVSWGATGFGVSSDSLCALGGVNVIFSIEIISSAVAAFLASLIVGVLLVRFRSVIEPFTRDREDHLAVQASHTGDPLRLGGVAVVIGLLVGAAVLMGHSAGTYTLLLLASLLPVFLTGLWEDLGHGVSPKGRVVAALMSSVVAVSLLGFWVSRVDMVGLDAVMAFAPAGVIITIVIAALFCHSVNLIDGMNGFAALTVILTALGISLVASQVDLRQISVLALLVAAGTFGFMLMNWPVAKLFLGDAGAYGLGHILIWLANTVIVLAPDVAVPAILLILFYPFADTLHTVFRRLVDGKKVTEPDRMHLHHKVRRGIEIVWIGRDRRHISNPLTTVLMVPFLAVPIATGVMFWDRPLAAWIALVVFGGGFGGSHLAITALARLHRKSFVCSRESDADQELSHL